MRAFPLFVALAIAVGACGSGDTPTSTSAKAADRPRFAYSAEYYCANGWLEYCAAADTVPSHAIVGSTWDRLHEAVTLISDITPDCESIRNVGLGLMDIPDRVRGYEGTEQFTPDDPNYPRNGLAFNVGSVIRLSDQMYPPGSTYADSLQRTFIHEVSHMIFNASEDEADAYEIECEGSDAWKVFEL